MDEATTIASFSFWSLCKAKLAEVAGVHLHNAGVGVQEGRASRTIRQNSLRRVEILCILLSCSFCRIVHWGWAWYLRCHPFTDTWLSGQNCAVQIVEADPINNWYWHICQGNMPWQIKCGEWCLDICLRNTTMLQILNNIHAFIFWYNGLEMARWVDYPWCTLRQPLNEWSAQPSWIQMIFPISVELWVKVGKRTISRPSILEQAVSQ